MFRGSVRFSVRCVCTLLLMLGLAAFCALPAGATQPGPTPSPTPDAPQVVRIGCPVYGGLLYQTEDDSYAGFVVDCMERVSAYTGWQCEYVLASRAELARMLQDGQLDLVAPALRAEAQADGLQIGQYALGVDTVSLYLPPKARSHIYYNDPATLDGLYVAMLRDIDQNDAYLQYAQQQGYSVTPLYFDTPAQCFAALDAQIADAVLIGSLCGAIPEDVYIGCRFRANPFYLAAVAENQPLLDALDQALLQVQLEEPYFISDTFARHFPQNSQNTPLLFTRQEGLLLSSGQTFHFGFPEGREPLSCADETGAPHGAFLDLARMITQELSLTAEYHLLNSSESSSAFIRTDSLHMLIGYRPTDSWLQQQNIIASNPIVTGTAVVVGRTTSTLELTKDLAFRVAVVASVDAIPDKLLQLYPNLVILPMADSKACLQAVVSGEADLTVQDFRIVSPHLAGGSYETLTILDANFMPLDYVVLLPDTEDARLLLSVLNKTLPTLNTNTIDQIFVDHTLHNIPEPDLLDIAYRFRAPLILIVLLLFGIILQLAIISRERRLRVQQEQDRSAQLAEAVKKARRAEQAKSEFLARMSHDMRTPMNAILGFAEVGRADAATPEQTECFTNIHMAGSYLLGLINDVLDMSRIEHQRFTLHPQTFRYGAFLQAIQPLLDGRAKARGVELQFTQSQEDFTVLLDRQRMMQILINLLTNSIKFTPAGGKVCMDTTLVSVKDNTAHLRFTVSDTGVGMSSDFVKHRLFEKFEQDNQPQDLSDLEGTGLGLSIVKELVDRMGGTVQCTSEIGKGTTFVVELTAPLAEPPKPAAAPAPVPVSTVLQGRHILLCEDHNLNIKLATKLLLARGMQVTVAQNGKQALDIYSNSAPGSIDAILMDIRMPVMDGLTATREIRALPRPDAAAVPILAMTANAFPDDIQKTKQAGMNVHLSKPIDPEVLYRELERCLTP